MTTYNKEESKNPKYSLCLIGSPGVGKSGLLNLVGGNFSSGYSAGNGMTLTLEKVDVNINGTIVRLYNMPGISRFDNSAKCIHIVKGAVNAIGTKKIIFIVTTESGRPSESSLAIILTVLNNLNKKIEVNIIINKCSSEDLENRNLLETFINDVIKNNLNIYKNGVKTNYLFIKRGDNKFPVEANIDFNNYIISLKPFVVTLLDTVIPAFKIFLGLAATILAIAIAE